MKKIIIANWKMNPVSLGEALKLAKSYDKKGVVIAPPFVFLETLSRVLKKAALGAQDVSYEFTGAHTGEISVSQLKSLGVRYVIIGHSERRALGETDAVINKKIKVALAGRLKVILCVGEKLGIRKRGIVAAKRFVAGQLHKDLKQATRNKRQVTSLIIAYEPIWAISTTRDRRDETPLGAGTMAGFIKELLVKSYKFKVRVLYGGSANAINAKLFLKARGIDGLLVGGASLKAREFKKIIKGV